ncbi:MAG TPA: bifunctional adenosylcobinamide kinase/adenosylcobinamide-phosphate guanylyltransferase [Victivallales bacterium]|nr:bifunctional adenosylcobinamide kinase/adenosylcobinamide-phosphate guanylyltransferase [Victivallales bacterium]
MIYLLTGGVRSGKSSYALVLAQKAVRPFYIATAWAGDGEMEERIKNHKAERGECWTTIEETITLDQAITQAISSGSDCIVIDCITMWVSNLLMGDKIDIQLQVNNFIDELERINKTDIIMVTNEVGLGIVPDNELSRKYRDLLGFTNQKLAKVAEKVIFMISGILMEIK